MGRGREAGLVCFTGKGQNSASFRGPAPANAAVTSTVLPPSFHPLNTRSPRDRPMAQGTTGLLANLALGLNGTAPSPQTRITPPGRNTPSVNTATRRETDIPRRQVPFPMSALNREATADLTPATIASLNAAMMQPPVGVPGWNGVGFFPLVPMDSLASGQMSAFGPWRAKQPTISRDYLELAMLVCNTFRGKLFPCPHCRYVTDRRNNLKRHIATMHETCEKVLECCGVVFQTKASLREHIMIFHHNGYSCPYCGRRFCRKALLKRHLSVHSGRKDYSCPHCDYATSHKSNLERHKKIHERSTKSPSSENKDPDVVFLDEATPLTLSTTSTTGVRTTAPVREPSPAPQDSTVTCSTSATSTPSGDFGCDDDVITDSDESLSDDDVDVECG